ncbi:MAG TPA: LamG domain-containing protein, partial [Spirochaetota bacterium]|nr:LamG domain-containing protein [Spirochaetota bacterium]
VLGTLAAVGSGTAPIFVSGPDEFKSGNSALRFPGGYVDGGRVDLGTSFDPGQVFTICGWFKAEAPIHMQKKELLFSNRTDLGGSTGFELFINNWEGSSITPDGDKVFGIVYSKGASTDTYWTTPSDFIVYGEWKHFAVSIDRTTLQGRVYFDGVASEEFSLSFGDFPVSGNPWYIGSTGYSGTGGAYFFKGYLDDIRVYKRVLSPEEILNISRN